MCSFRIAIAGQHVAILTGFLVIQLVGTVLKRVFNSYSYQVSRSIFSGFYTIRDHALTDARTLKQKESYLKCYQIFNKVDLTYIYTSHWDSLKGLD